MGSGGRARATDASPCSTRRRTRRWSRSPTARRPMPSPLATRPRRRRSKWAATPPRERSEILRNCWQMLVDHTDELASLIVREHGKPLADAKGEITYSAEFFRWNAEETVRIRGEVGTAPVGRQQDHRAPPARRCRADGDPVELPGGDDHPQARAGAGRRQRRRDQAAQGHAADGAACRRSAAGGRRSGGARQRRADQRRRVPGSRPRSSTRAVRMLSFTGSTEVGRVLLQRAADRVLKTVMELGGNAPFVVFDDADIDAAVEGAMVAKMRHSAETCTAANRFYVEAGAVDEFTDEVRRRDGRREDRQRLRRRRHLRSADQPRAVDDVDGLVQRGGRRRRHGRARWCRRWTAPAASTSRPC